jgi:hypothetical protein
LAAIVTRFIEQLGAIILSRLARHHVSAECSDGVDPAFFVQARVID